MPRPEPPRGGARAITSLQNERVKLIRSLEMRKVRRETGLFVAEGASVLVTARDAGWVPRMLVFLAGSAQAGVHARAAATGRRRPAPSAWRCRRPCSASSPPRTTRRPCSACSSSAGPASPTPRRVAADAVWLALEAVRDPGNLGTIVRTVDAVGAGGVILVGNCVDPYSREAVRASMGSIFNVPLVRMAPERFVAWAAAWPGDVVGTQLAAREDFRAVRYRAPTLLADGQRGAGPVARAGGRLLAPRQDPDGRPPRLAQPRRRHRADALRDPEGAAARLNRRGVRPPRLDVHR